jgi:hypothetical protein
MYFPEEYSSDLSLLFAGDAEKPIICMVRHLSPTGRLLSRSAFDFLMKTNPSAAAGKILEENTNELLQIEIGKS